MAALKHVSTSLLAMFIATAAWCQTEIRTPDLHVNSLVAPQYFGPNAFPVPDIHDGMMVSSLEVEIAGDYFHGNICKGEKDLTVDPFLKVRLPLFSDRVNLSLWMPVIEHWSFSDAVRQARRIPAGEALTGHDSGDAYVSLDIKLLEEDGWLPDVVIRSVLKTASGNSFGSARYYDAPGYFFDLNAANSIYFSSWGFVRELRGGVNAGFLCWQTDNGRQNDAVMYGLLAQMDTRAFLLSTQLAGYSGWEYNGDQPLTIKLRADFHTGAIEPFAEWSKGIKDWPFDQFRAGIVINPSGRHDR